MSDELNPESLGIEGFELAPEEGIWWKEAIKSLRSEKIKDPSFYINNALARTNLGPADLEKGIEEIMDALRSESWNAYLKNEADFHKFIITFLTEERPLPRQILTKLIDSELDPTKIAQMGKEKVFEKLATVVGSYAGSVMPYIYALCLSTTQSRRSRAGNEFESILEAFMDILGYPYNTQKKISKDLFKSSGLGKKVDLIMPSAEAYQEQRSKCAIVTAKTTLRERWQEVAEELGRTQVPHIYLVTLDTGVSMNVVNTMKSHNITLVVRASEKTKKFENSATVKSMDEFFFKELPHILSYWKK